MFVGVVGGEDRNVPIKDAKGFEDMVVPLKYNNPCEKPYITNAFLFEALPSRG